MTSNKTYPPNTFKCVKSKVIEDIWLDSQENHIQRFVILTTTVEFSCKLNCMDFHSFQNQCLSGGGRLIKELCDCLYLELMPNLLPR